MERVAKPANELEGLIRNRLPDAVRRRLTDVIIERSEGIEPNWIAQPVWSGHLSHPISGCSLGRCSKFVGTIFC